MADISTIVLTKNSDLYVGGCLDSILAQTVQPQEIILVDKSSSMATADVARQYGDRVRLYRQKSNGLAAARNEALDYCSAPYISFLDADDIWLPEKLEKQLNILEREPDINLVSCLLQKIEDGQLSESFEALTPSGCLFRKSVFEKHGKFSPQYTIASDHSWFFTSKRQHIRMHIIQEVLLHKHIHDRNLSLNAVQYRKEIMHMLHSAS